MVRNRRTKIHPKLVQQIQTLPGALVVAQQMAMFSMIAPFILRATTGRLKASRRERIRDAVDYMKRHAPLEQLERIVKDRQQAEGERR